MQLSCNVLRKPHQHMHDSSPWLAVFSTGQHHGGTYGSRSVVYVMVKVDGDVVCSAWMVFPGIAQRMMYPSKRLWYVRVHGMALVHGTGSGG